MLLYFSKSKETICAVSQLMSSVSESSPPQTQAHLNRNDLEMSGASKSASEGLDAQEPHPQRDYLDT